MVADCNHSNGGEGRRTGKIFKQTKKTKVVDAKETRR